MSFDRSNSVATDKVETYDRGSSDFLVTSYSSLPKVSTAIEPQYTASSSNLFHQRKYLPLDFDEVKYLKNILANKVRKPEMKSIRQRKAQATSSNASIASDSDNSNSEASSSSSMFSAMAKLPSLNQNRSLTNPKLGSMAEKLADCWQDDFERWCRNHQIVPKLKVTLNDKVALRNWFAALDDDGSGEVSIDELENPMISAGILRTRDEVKKCLQIWDTDHSGTISFDEFVDALRGNEMIDRKKIDQLRQYSQDPVFCMETLLTNERRNNVLYFVMEESQQRSKAAEDAAKALMIGAKNVNYMGTATSSAFHTAHKKFDDLERKQAVNCIQTDVYISSLEAVVHRHSAKLAALEHIEASASRQESRSRKAQRQLENMEKTAGFRWNKYQEYAPMTPYHRTMTK